VVYIGKAINGIVRAIKYTPGDLDTGTDLVIVGETTGIAILTKENIGTAAVWFFPVAAASKVADGAASSLTEVPVFVFRERIKITVDEGGTSTSGSIEIWVDE